MSQRRLNCCKTAIEKDPAKESPPVKQPTITSAANYETETSKSIAPTPRLRFYEKQAEQIDSDVN